MLKKVGESGIAMDQAEVFFGLARASREKKFKSVGHGWDFRFAGEGVIGSALLYRKKVIHVAFFPNENAHESGISSYRRRAGFRIR